jgi:hypothetical protein
MLRWPALLLVAALLPLSPVPRPDGPTYTADGSLNYPAGYPEWVFLGTGLDMSYNPQAMAASHSMFNSVFVNPSAYKEFKQSGHWPEGTVLVLENRGAAGDASIDKRGKTESSEVMGMEVHVKDTAHGKEGWAFYDFDDPIGPKATGKLIARPASCYTCHEQHAAVDTTFVQFYPFALEIAKEKGTLSAEYRKDAAVK